jgi:hypothetical protein
MKQIFILILLFPFTIFSQKITGKTVEYVYQVYEISNGKENLLNERKFTFSFYYDKILISGDSLYNTKYENFFLELSKNKGYLIDDDTKKYVEISLIDFKKLVNKGGIDQEGKSISIEKRKLRQRIERKKCSVYDISISDDMVDINQEVSITNKLGNFNEFFGYLSLLNTVFYPGIEGLVLKSETRVSNNQSTLLFVIEATDINDSFDECKNFDVPYNYISEQLNQ